MSKLTPYAVQARADELLAHNLPLTEDAVTKTVAQAVQSSDFKFRKLAIPVTVADGVLEMRRASFRDGEATVRMEGYIDLNKAQVDSTWQMGVSSDRRQKGPPVKLTLAGPLRELGARPRTPAAEDFVRAILIRKMEGDISKLEGLNKPGGASPRGSSSDAGACEGGHRLVHGAAARPRAKAKEEERGRRRREAPRARAGADLRAAHARRAGRCWRHVLPLSFFGHRETAGMTASAHMSPFQTCGRQPPVTSAQRFGTRA